MDYELLARSIASRRGFVVEYISKDKYGELIICWRQNEHSPKNYDEIGQFCKTWD